MIYDIVRSKRWTYIRLPIDGLKSIIFHGPSPTLCIASGNCDSDDDDAHHLYHINSHIPLLNCTQQRLFHHPHHLYLLPLQAMCGLTILKSTKWAASIIKWYMNYRFQVNDDSSWSTVDRLHKCLRCAVHDSYLYCRYVYVISFSTMTSVVIHADNPVSPRFDWDYFISSGR